MDTKIVNIKSLSMMVFIWIKQRLSNVWNSVHEIVQRHCGWVEKKTLLKKIVHFIVNAGPKNASWCHFLDNFCLFRANNRNIRERCEICSKLIKILERRHWRRSGVFIVNFEHISHLFLVFLLLILNK